MQCVDTRSGSFWCRSYQKPISPMFSSDTAKMRFFGRAVTPTLSQRLLHKMTNGGQFSQLVSTLVQTSKRSQVIRYFQVRHVVHRENGASTRGEIVSQTFTELHVYGDDRWPLEVWSNTHFRGVCSGLPRRRFRSLHSILLRPETPAREATSVAALLILMLGLLCGFKPFSPKFQKYILPTFLRRNV